MTRVLAFVGVCALSFGAVVQSASACPDGDKKAPAPPSALNACPDGDKKAPPSALDVGACPDGDKKAPTNPS
jgi:hypothetical protein